MSAATRKAMAQVIADSFYAMQAGEFPDPANRTLPSSGDMQLAADLEEAGYGLLPDSPPDDEREALARIIDPWAWEPPLLDNTYRGDRRRASLFCVDRLVAHGLRIQGPITDAQVEVAAQAFSHVLHQIELVWKHMKEQDRDIYRQAARAALEAVIVSHRQGPITNAPPVPAESAPFRISNGKLDLASGAEWPKEWRGIIRDDVTGVTYWISTT